MKNKKLTMTVDEMLRDIRKHGISISQKTFDAYLENGLMPFVKIINTGRTGRRTFFIVRKEYEVWIEGFMAELEA